MTSRTLCTRCGIRLPELHPHREPRDLCVDCRSVLRLMSRTAC